MTTATPLSGTKRRLSRPDRQRQLLDTAWALIRSEGTAPLTLGRLAEAAGRLRSLRQPPWPAGCAVRRLRRAAERHH